MVEMGAGRHRSLEDYLDNQIRHASNHIRPLKDRHNTQRIPNLESSSTQQIFSQVAQLLGGQGWWHSAFLGRLLATAGKTIQQTGFGRNFLVYKQSQSTNFTALLAPQQSRSMEEMEGQNHLVDSSRNPSMGKLR